MLPSASPSGLGDCGAAAEPDRAACGADVVLLFGGTSHTARGRTARRFGARSGPSEPAAPAVADSTSVDSVFDERGGRFGAHHLTGASALVVTLLRDTVGASVLTTDQSLRWRVWSRRDHGKLFGAGHGRRFGVERISGAGTRQALRSVPAVVTSVATTFQTGRGALCWAPFGWSLR